MRGYVLGNALHEMAGLASRHPDLLTGMDVSSYPFGFTLWFETKKELTEARKQLNGDWQRDRSKPVSKTFSEYKYSEILTFRTFEVHLECNRSTACKAVVVGTEEVEVPDYSNVPTKTITRDKIEWKCP